MAAEEFAISGLAPSYAFLIMTINAKPGIRPMEISEIMKLTPSTVTRLVEKMEYRGFVERRTSGKFTGVYPTENSIKLDETIKKAWRNLYLRYTNIIGEDEAANLTSNIYEVLGKLE